MSASLSHKLYGLHTVMHALQIKGRVKQLFVASERRDERIKVILDLANQQYIAVEFAHKHRLTQIAESDMHQGVVALCHPMPDVSLSSLESQLLTQTKPAFLLVLDAIQDPHNFGACMRSANASGVDAVIIPKHHSAKVTPVVHKVAAGATFLTPIITVNQLASTLEVFKTYPISCIGLSLDSNKTIYDCDLTQPIAIIMGNEGTGLTRATQLACDELVNIPMPGGVSSLNVSVATGIVLFEVCRQRQLPQPMN